MDSDDEEEEQKKTKAPKFPIQMYITEGSKYYGLAKYDLAIKFFNTALEREPNNEKSLVGRSKCKMRLAKYSEAMDDAKEALKANKNSCDAKLLIGEAEYFLGDFEKSFLTFYRGHQARSNHEKLRCGHQMSKRAIDNALLPDEPMTFDDTDISGVSKVEDVQEDEQVVQSRTRKDLLTPYVDFIDALLLDDSLDSVHPRFEYLNTYLKDRQTFWRSQNPKTTQRKVEIKNSAAKNDGFAVKVESQNSKQKITVTKAGKSDSSEGTIETGKDGSSKVTSEVKKGGSSKVTSEAGKDDSLKETSVAGEDYSCKVPSAARKEDFSNVTSGADKNDTSKIITETGNEDSSKVTSEAEDD